MKVHGHFVAAKVNPLLAQQMALRARRVWHLAFSVFVEIYEQEEYKDFVQLREEIPEMTFYYLQNK